MLLEEHSFYTLV